MATSTTTKTTKSAPKAATKKAAPKKATGLRPGDHVEPKAINLIKGMDYATVIVTLQMEADSTTEAKVIHILAENETNATSVDKAYAVVEWDEQIAVMSGDLDTDMVSVTYIAQFDAKRNVTPSRVSVNCSEDITPEMKKEIKRAFVTDATASSKINALVKVAPKAAKAKAETTDGDEDDATKAKVTPRKPAAAKRTPAKRPANKADASAPKAPPAAARKRGVAKPPAKTEGEATKPVARKRAPRKAAPAAV